MLDLAPTLLEAAGIPVPAGMQGRSLTALLTGQSTTHRDSVYMEFYNANFNYPVPPLLTSVRTTQWKLNYCNKAQYGELYDLRADPGEISNLWNNPHHSDTQQAMMQTLMTRMLDSVDPLPLHVAPW
jgi:arylsulfatase A-like enzyme